MPQWAWMAPQNTKTLADRHLSWAGCGLRLLGIVFVGRNQNTYLNFSLAGHLALSCNQTTLAPSGLARISKINPGGDGPVASLALFIALMKLWGRWTHHQDVMVWEEEELGL